MLTQNEVAAWRRELLKLMDEQPRPALEACRKAQRILDTLGAARAAADPLALRLNALRASFSERLEGAQPMSDSARQAMIQEICKLTHALTETGQD